ncbi:MAG: M48 family metallopeptidase [Rickettsiales bacterium]|jgi:predicted metal-dependent hydrolase|nr:M48 family metallopeptidase [Rickettsiales bacterium]
MNNDFFILSDGSKIPIVVQVRVGMRNITIRPKTAPVRQIVVGVPSNSSVAAGLKFLASKQKWIEKIYARAPEKTKLVDGDTITIFGTQYKIDAKKIGGRPEFLERRLRDKIKAKFLQVAKREMATIPPNLRPTKVCARDTTSRWGSCSSTGTISLSWRLAFAPPSVMRYVIMHEVAHRKHMDHSPAFWALVGELYGDGVGRAKLWLSRNGASLHRYF